MTQRSYWISIVMGALFLTTPVTAGDFEDLGKGVDQAVDRIGPRIMGGLEALGKAGTELGDRVASGIDGLFGGGGGEVIDQAEKAIGETGEKLGEGLGWVAGQLDRGVQGPAAGFEDLVGGKPADPNRNGTRANGTRIDDLTELGRSSPSDYASGHLGPRVEPTEDPWFRVHVLETATVIDVVVTPTGNHTWIDGEWISPDARADEVAPAHLEILFGLRNGTLSAHVERLG